jgi:hypothetical protein
MAAIDPLTAGAVFIATAATDAVYVMFTSAVIARKRVPAANWSAVWYMLSSYEGRCFHTLIASEAKQSRVFPRWQSGLLRRKSSSQ